MTTINLKDFYAWYTHDEYIEVSDEVAAELKADKLYEAAHQRRTTRNKAQYSLDCDDGIEYSACLHEPTPQELLDRMELFVHLWNALNSLPEVQGVRVEAHLILGKSYRPDCPGTGCGQERCPALGEARHDCYEKIFEKSSVSEAPFARFLSLVYER